MKNNTKKCFFMFVDCVIINVKAGDGGNGKVSFLRASYQPDGGADGGNGGDGGDVILKASCAYNDLFFFKRREKFIAENGIGGGARNKHGRRGASSVFYVPIGTEVYDKFGHIKLAELNEEGREFTLAKGGKGGLGNQRFKGNKDVDKLYNATSGEAGERGEFLLNLQVIADFGLIGLPNAGKSSILNSITRRISEVADYQFTTLSPIIGMADVDYNLISIADTPGLIEGASEGFGLGLEFLKHIEKCIALLHVIDSGLDDIIGDYNTIQEELARYKDGVLLEKQRIIILNKSDLLYPEQIAEKIKEIKGITGEGTKIFVTSAENRENWKEEFLQYILKLKLKK